MRRTMHLTRIILLSLCAFACSAADNAPAGQKNAQTANDKAIDTYLLKAMQADSIRDPVKRCIAYPNMPGISWSKEVVAARCRREWESEYTLMRINDVLDEPGGAQKLDRYLSGLLHEHYNDPTKRERIFIVFGIFRGSSVAAETAAAWLAAAPDSAYAQLAAGVQKDWAAGEMRGSDSYSATPKHRLEKMSRLVEEASSYFDRALVLEPTLSPACTGLLGGAIIASGNSAVIAERCVKMDPYSYHVVNKWRQSVEPRWGGSEEEMQSVVDHIDRHSNKNPALQTIKAIIAGYRYEVAPYESLGDFLEPLLAVAKIAPSSGVFEKLSMAYAYKGEPKLSLAAQTQAVRFEPSSSRMRRSRMFSTFMITPAWSLLDAEELVRQFPNHAEFRIDLKLAEGFIALEKSGRLALMDKSRFSYGDVGVNSEESNNATLQDECLRFRLNGRSEDLGSSGIPCEDKIIKKAPTDPNAWRVRAEVLRYFDNTAGALEAAKQYLQIADPNDPAFEINRKRFERWIKQEKR